VAVTCKLLKMPRAQKRCDNAGMVGQWPTLEKSVISLGDRFERLEWNSGLWKLRILGIFDIFINFGPFRSESSTYSPGGHFGDGCELGESSYEYRDFENFRTFL